MLTATCMVNFKGLLLTLVAAVGFGFDPANADSSSTFMVDFDKLLTVPELRPEERPEFRPPVQGPQCDSREIRGRAPNRLWRSLGTLDLPTGRGQQSQCNVWHVGGEYNITNCHCVSHRGRIGKKVSVNFFRGSNYQNDGCIPMNCQSGLDYAVVRCPGQTGQVEPVKISQPGFPIDLGNQVHLLTFDRDDPPVARVSSGTVQERVPGVGHFSTSRAKSGNSGSPIFDDSGAVTCLLHSIDPTTENRRGYGKSYCTNIQSILANMKRTPELQRVVAAVQASQEAIQVEEYSCGAGQGLTSDAPSTR